jgi:integrase
MASSKIVLFKGKRNSDGSRYVALRLTFDRKHTFIFIDSIQETDWLPELKQVKNTHPNYRSINSAIKTKDLQAYDLIIEYEKGTSDLTPDQIIAKLRGKKTSETFFDFLAEYVEEYKEANKFDEASSLESKAKNIWSFVNKKDFPIKATKEIKFSEKSIFRLRTGKDIVFTEINSTWLRKLDTFLKIQKEQSIRSVFNHQNMIRVVFNRAISAKVIKEEVYPFNDFTITMPESQKIPLEKEEINLIEKVKLESETDNWIHAKNSWLFSFCFGGQRISDVLATHHDDFQGGKLHYVMGKNNKPVAIKIPKRAQKIIKYYLPFKEENKGFIFPVLKDADFSDPTDVKRKLKNGIRLYTKWLKKIAIEAKIDKNISPHLSRHTFGHLAGDEIDLALLQKIYKHADIRTTINYQQIWSNQKKIDQAISNVVDNF